MTRDEAFRVATARFQQDGAFDGFSWAPGDTVVRDIFNAGWDAHEEALKQSAMPFTNPDLAAKFTSRDRIYAIYNAYPRKVGKQGAIIAIEKALKRGADAERVLRATEAYAKAVAQWPQEDRQYVPFPATWFNRGSYDDDPDEWTRGQAKPVSQFSKSY